LADLPLSLGARLVGPVRFPFGAPPFLLRPLWIAEKPRRGWAWWKFPQPRVLKNYKKEAAKEGRVHQSFLQAFEKTTLANGPPFRTDSPSRTQPKKHAEQAAKKKIKKKKKKKK